MLPLPSRTHPKNKTWVVYTEELTHLPKGLLVGASPVLKSCRSVLEKLLLPA